MASYLKAPGETKELRVKAICQVSHDLVAKTDMRPRSFAFQCPKLTPCLLHADRFIWWQLVPYLLWNQLHAIAAA